MPINYIPKDNLETCFTERKGYLFGYLQVQTFCFKKSTKASKTKTVKDNGIIKIDLTLITKCLG